MENKKEGVGVKVGGKSELRLQAVTAPASISNDAAATVARLIGFVAALDEKTLVPTLIGAANAAEAGIESTSALPLSDASVEVGLSYLTILDRIAPVDERVSPEVTLNANHPFVPIILKLLENERFLRGLEQNRLKIRIADLQNKKRLKDKVFAGIPKSYRDPILKETAGKILSDWIMVSDDSFEMLAGDWRRAAIFVESEAQAKSFANRYTALVEGQVKETQAIVDMLLYILIGAGRLARATHAKDFVLSEKLLAELHEELGFDQRSKNFLSISIARIEQIYSRFLEKKQIESAA